MFIGRRGDNSIFGCWTVQQFEGQEELPDNHPDVIAFLNPPPPTQEQLAEQANARLDADHFNRLLFEMNYDQESRLRVLEGRPAITKLQYKTALANVYKTLP